MSRTALKIVQDAALKLGIDVPTELFASTDRTAMELRRALIEAADQIVRAHDWQLLKGVETHTGDGTTTEYAFPSDYLRMPKDAELWSSRWERPLTRVEPEQWLMLDVRDYNVVHGSWTIFGGNFVYKPALASTETAKFFYVSENCCAAADATAKAEFTADDDTFRLDDRVLEFTLIWVWRQQKELDYSEDMMTANMALAREISKDKGARILRPGARRDFGAEMSFPFEVTP